MDNCLKKTLSTVRRVGAPALLLTALFSLPVALEWGPARSVSGETAEPSDGIYVNHDLSTGDLLQWIYRDYGLGTNIGSNASDAGYLWYHANVLGQRAAGLTATGSAHASPAAYSDSVYLWDPTEAWNYAPTEFWVRTSFLFPTHATLAAVGAEGEQPYRPTPGDWNWFFELHNDSNPQPGCSKELANVALEVKTDDVVVSGAVGTKNVRLAARIMGGAGCSPNVVWINGPALVWDHWYELLLHVKLDPSGGIFEWYIDDTAKPYYSNLNIPTLYTRPSGYLSPSYTSLTIANYRLHAPWASTIYLGPLVLGTTKDVVANAF
jgi:hypothetical protein